MKECSSLISIIVPIYNVEKYLRKCIDSLINQTYKNIEIILVDDESPDKSGQICDDYARIDNRIRVIHQSNSGVGKARENGMDIARGEYLTFVDSDDWIAPEFCERMAAKLQENNADWAACNARKLDETGKEIESFNNIEEPAVIQDKQILMDHYFEGKMYPRVVWGKIFKKSAIEGLRFQTLKICEDTCFMTDLIKDDLKVCLTTEYDYNYLRRDSSVTSNNKFRVEDFDWLKGLEYIKSDVQKICPWHCREIENQRREILLNMYILLIEKGTRYEKIKYKNLIRNEIVNSPYVCGGG